MGWLGYTEQETAATRLQLLERAHKGCVDKILATQGIGFGAEPAAPAEPPPAAAVMGAFRAAFGK